MGGGEIVPGVKVPSFEEISNTVRDSVSGAYKNIERTAQNATQGVAAIASGNFNNADRTLMDLISLTTGGGLVNPDDITAKTGKETVVERMTTEAEKKAQEDEARALALAEQTRLDSINTFITKSIAQRTATPGRAQTLLNNVQGGSLLTRV